MSDDWQIGCNMLLASHQLDAAPGAAKMSEPVERVAKAIAHAQLLRQYVGRLEDIGAVIEIDHIWPEFIPKARAAISAMREPTPEMIAAAINEFRRQMSPGGELAVDFAKIFQSMIDEMLK
jgi:hypothetical protein